MKPPAGAPPCGTSPHRPPLHQSWPPTLRRSMLHVSAPTPRHWPLNHRDVGRPRPIAFHAGRVLDPVREAERVELPRPSVLDARFSTQTTAVHGQPSRGESHSSTTLDSPPLLASPFRHQLATSIGSSVTPLRRTSNRWPHDGQITSRFGVAALRQPPRPSFIRLHRASVEPFPDKPQTPSASLVLFHLQSARHRPSDTRDVSPCPRA